MAVEDKLPGCYCRDLGTLSLRAGDICSYCERTERELLAADVRRGLYAIIYGDNGATDPEVAAARAWLRSQGIEPR